MEEKAAQGPGKMLEKYWNMLLFPGFLGMFWGLFDRLYAKFYLILMEISSGWDWLVDSKYVNHWLD